MKQLISIALCSILLVGLVLTGCTPKKTVTVDTTEKEPVVKKTAEPKKVEEPKEVVKRQKKVIGPNDELIIATMEIPPYHYETKDGKIDEKKRMANGSHCCDIKRNGSEVSLG